MEVKSPRVEVMALTDPVVSTLTSDVHELETFSVPPEMLDDQSRTASDVASDGTSARRVLSAYKRMSSDAFVISVTEL